MVVSVMAQSQDSVYTVLTSKDGILIVSIGGPLKETQILAVVPKCGMSFDVASKYEDAQIAFWNEYRRNGGVRNALPQLKPTMFSGKDEEVIDSMISLFKSRAGIRYLPVRNALPSVEIYQKPVFIESELKWIKNEWWNAMKASQTEREKVIVDVMSEAGEKGILIMDTEYAFSLLKAGKVKVITIIGKPNDIGAMVLTWTMGDYLKNNIVQK